MLLEEGIRTGVLKIKLNDLGISQIYYDYRNRTYINIAEEWCRNHHVPYRRKED